MSDSNVDVVDDTDLRHLRLLSIFHYVVAGMMGLFTCFPGIYVGLGVMFLTNPPMQPGQNPEELKEGFYNIMIELDEITINDGKCNMYFNNFPSENSSQLDEY